MSIGICVIGTFFDGPPNDLALDALDKLMQCGYDNVSINMALYTVYKIRSTLTYGEVLVYIYV